MNGSAKGLWGVCINGSVICVHTTRSEQQYGAHLRSEPQYGAHLCSEPQYGDAISYRTSPETTMITYDFHIFWTSLKSLLWRYDTFSNSTLYSLLSTLYHGGFRRSPIRYRISVLRFRAQVSIYIYIYIYIYTHQKLCVPVKS